MRGPILITAFMKITFCYFFRMSRKIAAGGATIADDNISRTRRTVSQAIPVASQHILSMLGSTLLIERGGKGEKFKKTLH